MDLLQLALDNQDLLGEPLDLLVQTRALGPRSQATQEELPQTIPTGQPLSRACHSTSRRFSARFKTPAPMRRDAGADLWRRPEQPPSNSGNAVVDAIAPRGRNSACESRADGPNPSQPPHHIKGRGGPRQKGAGGCSHDDAVGQSLAVPFGSGAAEGAALQRSEMKKLASIPRKDKKHEPMTKAAMAVIENRFARIVPQKGFLFFH